MKSETHTQCELRHKDGRILVSWIPTAFAVPKRPLKLRERGAPWEDGWTVSACYSTLPTETVLAHEQDYKHQRETSDI